MSIYDDKIYYSKKRFSFSGKNSINFKGSLIKDIYYVITNNSILNYPPMYFRKNGPSQFYIESNCLNYVWWNKGKINRIDGPGYIVEFKCSKNLTYYFKGNYCMEQEYWNK